MSGGLPESAERAESWPAQGGHALGRPSTLPQWLLHHAYLKGLPDTMQLGQEVLVTVAAQQLCPEERDRQSHATWSYLAKTRWRVGCTSGDRVIR